jgi:hypothetical protein
VGVATATRTKIVADATLLDRYQTSVEASYTSNTRKRERMRRIGKSQLDVHFDGAEAELAGSDGGLESGHDHGIELGSGQGTDAVHGVVYFHR